MHHFVFIAIFGFSIAAASTNNDPMSICKEHKKYFSGDNKTERNLRKYISPKKVDKQNDIDSIFKYDKKLQDLVNLQIRIEMFAFYKYLSMSQFFKRYDQDRQGFAKYFRDAATEELGHAEDFMKYQQMRGGKVEFAGIPAVIADEDNWRNGKDVFYAALYLEKNVTGQILCLHSFAVDRFDDVDFANFLEEKVIPEQYRSMKEIQTHIKTLERACPNEEENNGQCNQYPIYELRFDEMLLKKLT